MDFNVRALIQQICPLFTNQYWFFTCYVLLIFIAPWLNHFIGNLEKQEYQKLLLLLFGIFSVIPSINIFGDTFGTQNGYSLLWFIVLYLFAGYIRRFGVPKKHYGIAYIVFCMINLLLTEAGQLFNVTVFNVLINLLTTLYNSFLVLGASICLFLCAEQSSFDYGRFSKVICKIARLSFGVYLLHENKFFRDVLWKQWAGLSEFTGNAGVFAVRLIAVVFLVFFAGIIIEWIRCVVVNIVCNLGKVFLSEKTRV